MESEINYILKIEYSHCIAPDDGRALHEQDFEYRNIEIPFSIFYPVRWMKTIFYLDKTPMRDTCENAESVKIQLEDIPYNKWISYMIFDAHLKWGDCNRRLQYRRVNGNLELEDIKPISRKYYEDNLNSDFIECDQCYYATVEYCDRIYNEMLDRIRKSIITSILCLRTPKSMKIPRDIIVLLEKTIWNTRHEIDWIKLDANQVKIESKKSNTI